MNQDRCFTHTYVRCHHQHQHRHHQHAWQTPVNSSASLSILRLGVNGELSAGEGRKSRAVATPPTLPILTHPPTPTPAALSRFVAASRETPVRPSFSWHRHTHTHPTHTSTQPHTHTHTRGVGVFIPPRAAYRPAYTPLSLLVCLSVLQAVRIAKVASQPSHGGSHSSSSSSTREVAGVVCGGSGGCWRFTD